MTPPYFRIFWKKLNISPINYPSIQDTEMKLNTQKRNSRKTMQAQNGNRSSPMGEYFQMFSQAIMV